MACQFPEGLILRRFSFGQLFSFFIPAFQCTVIYGQHRPPTSSTFFQTTLLSPSFHPKALHYSSHPPLILIFMLLISGDIHPNPGPIDPCSVCSRRVTWGNRSVQSTNCSLWAHLSCSGLSPADFHKISPRHSWTCPNPVSLSLSVSPSTHTPNFPPSLTNTHKTISSQITPPKQPQITPPILLINPN